MTDTPHGPTFTDGVIHLRPLIAEDAADHLAGEDDAMATWLNGGRSTLENVKAAIQRFQDDWQSDGPRRAFGVFDCTSDRLIGFVEANLARVVAPGQVNVAYGIFAAWRGRGLAQRAIDLVERYLKSATGSSQIVLRIAPANAASLRVAEKAGFTFVGVFEEPEGRMARYIRDIKP